MNKRVIIRNQNRARQWFLVVSGLVFVIVGVLVSEPVLASFTEDGTIGSNAVRVVLWGLSIGLVLVGLGVILLRRSDFAFRLVVMLVIALVMFGLLDYALYFGAHLLSPKLVRIMSPQAQLRHHNAWKDEEGWIYEANFRHGRPNVILDGAQADEFGYRNPAGYTADLDTLDVLIIGDSFIWGTGEQTIADYMRAERPNTTVYSAGVFGNSMVQWRYHFEDVVNRIGLTPEVVVFNFYAGNDLSDTEFYERVEAFTESDTAVTYFVYYNNPYLIPSEPDGFTPPKLPEAAFILMGILASEEQNSAEPTRLNTNYTIDELWPIFNEPRSEEFTEAVLTEIDKTVATVRELAPETEIVISYIPTMAGIYGDLLPDCPWCTADIEQQQANSAVLQTRAEQLGIHYVDVVPELQEAALERPLWATNGHFSEQGYAVYGQALSDAVADIQDGR